MPKNKVIYSSPFVPAEWIVAHGLLPSRRSCMGHGCDAPVHVMAGVCPYMRSFINRAAEDSDTLAIICATSCDQMRRGFDFVNLKTKVPCFLMNIPSSSQTPGAYTLYKHELERLGEFLISIGGLKPEPETLISIMLDYDRKRRELLSNQDTMTAGEFAQALDRFHDTGQIEMDHKKQESISRNIPLGIIGGPLAKEYFDIFDILADNEGEVVVNGTETGVRTLPSCFDLRRLSDEALQVLAESYFGAIPGIFERPNNRVFLWVREAVKNHGVRGMILVRYLWCDKWHSEVQRLREWLPVPLLDIELDGNPLDGRATNRIQSFMEMLQ